MNYVGIDPGANGGVAVLTSDGQLRCWRTPKTEAAMVGLLLSATAGDSFTVVERVGGYVGGEGQPGSRMFSFGRSAGLIVGCLLSLGKSFAEVEPQRWQGMLSLKKVRGTSKDDWKRYLQLHARELHPTTKITLATADAVLLVHCARLLTVGFAAPEGLEAFAV